MGWLSILLKVVVIGLVLNELLLNVPLPVAVYQRLVPVWRRLGFGRGTVVALRRLASDATGRGDLATALQLSREAVQIRLARLPPDFPFQLLNLAQNLFRRRQLDASIEWFTVADDCTRADFRSKPAILLGLASSLTFAGRSKEAESALDRASTLYDESPIWREFGMDYQRWWLRTPKYRRQVANARAFAAMQSERFEDARRWYENMQTLPGTPSRHEKLATLNNLAAVSVELGDLGTAERYLNDAESLAGTERWPGQDYFLNTRGTLRLAQGRLTEARALFTQVLALRGTDAPTLLFLAQTAYRQGSFEDAIRYIDRITTHPREAFWRHKLAEILESLAEFDDLAGRAEVAEKRRTEASKFRSDVPHPTVARNDSLIVAVRSRVAGKRFGGLSTPGGLALGLYLSAFLWLGLVILLPVNLPSPAILLEACLLVLLLAIGAPLNRWLFSPQIIPG